jgi:hypothetical protein
MIPKSETAGALIASMTPHSLNARARFPSPAALPLRG